MRAKGRMLGINFGVTPLEKFEKEFRKKHWNSASFALIPSREERVLGVRR